MKKIADVLIYIALFIVAVFIAAVSIGAFNYYHPTTIADCKFFNASEDNFYWQQYRNGLTCAQIYSVKTINNDKPLDGSDKWWVVYVVGTKKSAIFSDFNDAVKWTDAQKLVVLKNQVR